MGEFIPNLLPVLLRTNFQMVLNSILKPFCFIVQKLCILLNDKRIYIRTAEALYKITIPPLIMAEVNPLINTKHDQDAQPNPPHICQNSHPVYHYSSYCYSLWQFLEEEENIYEQQLRFKGDVDGRDGGGVNVFAYLSHCWFHNPVATFFLCLLDCAYHVEFQLVKKSCLWTWLWDSSCIWKN